MTDDLTTLVCLFHHPDQAHAALNDLIDANVPRSSISLLDGTGSAQPGYGSSSLDELGVPARDQQHLQEGIRNGGVILAVSAISDHVDKVESIFGKHKATKIDEAVIDNKADYPAPLAPLTAEAGEVAIPVVAEELVVGKRAVNQGGVRLYRRIIEVPVDASVSLHEEHVTVNRRPVNRAVNDSDLAFGGDRTIELTETAEEAVVGKSARVVEEIRLAKDSTERVEHIHDTVRETEVEVEEIVPGAPTGTLRQDR